MNTPARSVRADIVQLPAPALGGAPLNAWNGVPNSGDTILFANNDSTNTWYLGFRNTITVGGQNTIPLFPNSTVTLGANRTIYATALPGTTPLLVVPGGVYYYTKTTQAPTGGATLGEDPSTPATVRINGTIGVHSGTTVSFSPPASSLLVCTVNVPGASVASTTSVSDSGAHTWTRRVSQDSFTGTGNPGTSAIFTTFLSTAPGSITVTGQSSDANASAIQVSVRVINGANSNQGSAATVKTSGTQASGTANQQVSITTTQAGSWVYCAGVQASGNDSSAIAGTTTVDDFNVVAGNVSDSIMGRQSSPTGTPGPTTLGWTFNAGAGADWTIAALEILHALWITGMWPKNSGEKRPIKRLARRKEKHYSRKR